MTLLMNKTLLITAMAIVFASAFVIIGSNIIVQSAHACPNKSSGASAPNVNPTAPGNINVQLTPQSSQLVSGQSA
jgi:hypothetical protein